MSPAGQVGPPAGPFEEYVQAARRAHLRRERLQAALDALRWTGAGFALASVAAAALRGPAAGALRVWLAAAAAALAAAVYATLWRRRVRDPASLVAAMDEAAGAGQLLLTAWECSSGRLATPFGPAIVKRAEALLQSRPPALRRLVPPLEARARTLAALLAAALAATPGLDALLYRLAQQTAGEAGRGPGAVAPDEAALLEQLAALLQQEAEATGDAGAARAAAELRRQAVPDRPVPSGQGPAAAGPPEPGPAQPVPGLEGAAPDAARSGWPSDRLRLQPLDGQVSLLMRLARLGLISPETADRAAEVLAMLASGSAAFADRLEQGTGALPSGAAQEASPGPAAVSPQAGPGALPPAGAGATRQSGTDPALRPGAGSETAQAGGPGGEGAGAPGPRDLGAAPAGEGPPGQPPPSGEATVGQSPTPAPSGQPSGAPGSGPGAMWGEPQEPPGASGAALIPLGSSPQLGPGPAHVLPGMPAPPPAEQGPSWRGAAAGQAEQGGSAPSPEIESVPVEYRDAVRRYFQLRAGEEVGP